MTISDSAVHVLTFANENRTLCMCSAVCSVCVCVCVCVCVQLSARCSPRMDVLIDCAVCSVSSLSYPTPDLSINHAVSKKAPIKLKGGLRRGERERERGTGNLPPEMEGVVVPLQLVNRPPFGEKTHKTVAPPQCRVMEGDNFSPSFNKEDEWKEKVHWSCDRI